MGGNVYSRHLRKTVQRKREKGWLGAVTVIEARGLLNFEGRGRSFLFYLLGDSRHEARRRSSLLEGAEINTNKD